MQFIGCLSNGADLRSQLNLSQKSNTAAIVKHTYLKWDKDFPRHLQGRFQVAIIDKLKHRCLIATDRLNKYPIYFTNSKHNTAHISSEFKWLCKQVNRKTINANMFIQFALDRLPLHETCYKDIHKLGPGELLIYQHNHFVVKKYWQPSDWKTKIKYKSRTDYYEHFSSLLSKTIKQEIQNKNVIVSQLSGGLDSSAITSLAAYQTSKQDQKIHSFTALPNNLEGSSYRTKWKYHERELVNNITQQYSNIIPYFYYSNPHNDPFETLREYYDCIDQPLRNVFNYDWLIGCLRRANLIKCDLLLNGQLGNGSISWKGYSPIDYAKQWLKHHFLPLRLQKKWMFQYTTHELLNQEFIPKLCNNAEMPLRPQDRTLLNPYQFPRLSSRYAIESFHQIHSHDPSADDDIRSFCQNIPQWVFYRDKKPVNRRLLIREGMKDYMPELIRMNTYRGEQAADWYLQYNNHYDKWRHALCDLSKETNHLIWKIYNKASIFSLLDKHHHIEKPSREATIYIRCQLARCLSAAFFLEHLLQKPNVSLD